MDKYARLMKKLEIVNIEFFKGIRQLFGIFFHFVFENFGHLNANPPRKASNDVEIVIDGNSKRWESLCLPSAENEIVP
ncbi:hypothetical protein M8C21_020062, partial [Ambrosia artemisiifolia]